MVCPEDRYAMRIAVSRDIGYTLSTARPVSRGLRKRSTVFEADLLERCRRDCLIRAELLLFCNGLLSQGFSDCRLPDVS